jgi:hypothetical protein
LRAKKLPLLDLTKGWKIAKHVQYGPLPLLLFIRIIYHGSKPCICGECAGTNLAATTVVGEKMLASPGTM